MIELAGSRLWEALKELWIWAVAGLFAGWCYPPELKALLLGAGVLAIAGNGFVLLFSRIRNESFWYWAWGGLRFPLRLIVFLEAMG